MHFVSISGLVSPSYPPLEKRGTINLGFIQIWNYLLRIMLAGPPPVFRERQRG
jgi:hypothetical protein